METAESRFAYLMQPIREITKNWDVNVAAELDDYLEELDQICISLDGGKTQLNFAEAALLIQGSTHIYSKKVEMLHNLVYQTLDYIRDSNNKRSKEAAVCKDGGDGAVVCQDDDYYDDSNFCRLDLEESDWLDRAEDNAPVKVPPLPPVSLIPPEIQDKQNFPLISAEGNVVCSQKDFRMNIFLPGPDGMICLMPPSNAITFLQDAGVIDSAPDGPEITADGPEQSFHPAYDGMEVEQDVDEHIERQQVPSRKQPQAIPKDTAAPPANNMWSFHDPYAILEENTPFKLAKTYKVPAGLDNKKNQRQALQDFTTWFKEIYDPPEHKLKRGPSNIDLNYIYQSTIKSKLKLLKKREEERLRARISDEALMSMYLEPEDAGVEENLDDLPDADRDEQDLELCAAGDDLCPEDEQLCYEALVHQQVEQLAIESQDYAQQTKLSRRIEAWKDELRPKLLQQESRPPFDIHEYGNRIVSALGSIGQRRSFASIVHGLDNFEATRLLLASLHLANDSTVDIDSVEDVEERLDSFHLTLLSNIRAAPALAMTDDNDQKPAS
ncbi:condensin-2 complex subunit H2 isoform X2 [Festucalex cinctus]